MINTMPAAPVVVYTGAQTPQVEPGDVWRSLRNGFLLFAVVSDGLVLFMLPDATDIEVLDAAQRWAPLERLIHGPSALVFEAPAKLTPLEPARFYDELRGGLPPEALEPGVWHEAFDAAHGRHEAADEPDADATAALPVAPPVEDMEPAS